MDSLEPRDTSIFIFGAFLFALVRNFGGTLDTIEWNELGICSLRRQTFDDVRLH